MKIVQILVTLQRGDAIGNFTIKLRDIFNECGYDTQIYAYNIGKGIDSGVAKRIELFNGVDKDDLIVYQMCESHEINDIIKRLECRKIAIYHNVTPAAFFNEYGKWLYEKQEQAIRDLSDMSTVFDKVIAVSEFNKNDLLKMGYSEDIIEVIPIIIDFDDYKKSPDEKVLDLYMDEKDNILFVGRIAPNKKQEDIIRIFAYYHKFINSESRLFLIGSPFIQDYDAALKEYISYLGIDDSVVMPGHSTFSEVLAYYRCADLFLCMSEHEGFCVPLVEAMVFDVPIMAYDSSAIAYTLGNSGILVQSKEPEKISLKINEFLTDDLSVQNVIMKQRQLLQDFELTKLRGQYERVFRQLVKGGEACEKYKD